MTNNLLLSITEDTNSGTTYFTLFGVLAFLLFVTVVIGLIISLVFKLMDRLRKN